MAGGSSHSSAVIPFKKRGRAWKESESGVGFGALGMVALVMCGEESRPLKKLGSDVEALAFLHRI
jgi:hypothetical protein